MDPKVWPLLAKYIQHLRKLFLRTYPCRVIFVLSNLSAVSADQSLTKIVNIAGMTLHNEAQRRTVFTGNS